MPTFDDLASAYCSTHRVTQTALIPAAEADWLRQLAAGIDGAWTGTRVGDGTKAGAVRSIAQHALGTTEVALTTYQFFTDRTPSVVGLDYLVSATGPNTENLNSAYYQRFSTENRFINFAVNLGRVGEGSQKFTSEYGRLTLNDAFSRAYVKIFGTSASSLKINDVLEAQVANGSGGVMTRAQYFASYGGDGAEGVGTKAAMVGWLLAESGKSHEGRYAEAADAMLQHIAMNGSGRAGSDMIATYGYGGRYAPGGPLEPGLPGVTLAIRADQSVVTPEVWSAEGGGELLQATAGNDIVRSTTGLIATSFVTTGGGNDQVRVTGGLMAGRIDSGSGADDIRVEMFGAGGVIAVGGGWDTVGIERFAGASRIEGFEKGKDVLFLAGSGSVAGAEFASPPSFADMLSAVASATGAQSNTVFEWGDSTYVFHQDGDAVVNLSAGDGLIRLVGVTDLTVGDAGTSLSEAEDHAERQHHRSAYEPGNVVGL